MKNVFLVICYLAVGLLNAQISLGTIQPNTNAALPESYEFQEYVYAEPDDQGGCQGAVNNTATIEEVYLAQTHRQAIGHPLFFTIGYRPALLQLAVTGNGAAPDVTVEGTLNGSSLGTLCLAGPAELSSSIDLEQANFDDYFSVTLPKNWVEDGLEFIVRAGSSVQIYTSADLKIGPYTEMNLVMVNMDFMDYNGAPHQWPIFADFLEEMASAIPASVVRFGIFPETLAFPEVIASNDTEQVVRLNGRAAKEPNGIFSDGYINSIAALFAGNMHRSTGDYLSTVYFGNTLNLSPGGWGGGKSFVGFDFTDIFIHELGHALSLPHWGEGSFANENPNEYNYLYPYGGTENNGGGRGSAWNFNQDSYQFVSPDCQDEDNQNLGEERSDCMQRNNACIETRSDGSGPWDGYGDFSALAIHRYLVGGEVTTGQVDDRGTTRDYQFRMQDGFPTVSLTGGQRTYTRDALQPTEIPFDHQFIMPGEEQLNQEVYLIYGTAHETQEQGNIVYKPVKFNGTLPPIIDPTDPVTFAELQNPEYIPHYYGTRDIVLKMTYEDGSVLHALNPFHSFERAPYDGGFSIWRPDICNYALVVPGDQALAKVEIFHRSFCVRWDDIDTEGNINYAPHGITAENFMDDAVYQTKYEFGQPLVLGSNTIGNRVWHDLNQNGIDDNGEEGIADVSLVIWRDSNGDGIPDGSGFGGVVKTDENGYYNFSGLGPGNYLVFVWSVDNWGEGEPLNGMVPIEEFVADPNTDTDLDNNGRPGNLEWGLSEQDLVSGMITLTADGEPLNDGDREDCWFDYDASGNMTIDFGFYVDGAVVNTTSPNNVHDLISIYPNPFENYLIVEAEKLTDHSLSIVDINGKVIFRAPSLAQTTRIDLIRYPTGVYTAVVRDKKGKVAWRWNLVRRERRF